MAPGGFSFGSKYISTVAPSHAAAASPSKPSAAIPADLDGELAQHLLRLTKRDATTRLKALQALKACLPEKSADDVAAMLPPWAYCFSRLVMDPSRGVRAEACAVMGVVAVGVGRGLAPFLKAIYPPWFLAKYDDARDVAAAAAASMDAAFPVDQSRDRDALFFCAAQVSCFAAVPEPESLFLQSAPQWL